MKAIGKGTALLVAVLFGSCLENAIAQTPASGERHIYQYHETSLEFVKAVQLSDGKNLGPGTYKVRIGYQGRGPSATLEFWQNGKLIGKQDGVAHGFPDAAGERAAAFSFATAGFGPGSRASLSPGNGFLTVRLQSSNSPAYFQGQLKLAPAAR